MTSPKTYVMAYELTEYGIDVYSGDAKLDVKNVELHDELLPALPTLTFSCAKLLTGSIGVVIRERGLRQYQFTIGTVGISGPNYQYACKAAESYVLTTAIMALQTAYGSTSDALGVIVPSLNIFNAQLLTRTTYPQIFVNITPADVIDQLMIQALAQASVRNGNMYVFPLDVSAQTPDYHMQRLDPLTTWQRDEDIYGAVIAHYMVKQYPTPFTVLTLNDASNWIGTVTDVTQVATSLLSVPSGAPGMLKSVGNASRANLSTLFRYFDRVRFNWCPVAATSVTVSLQQDALNKLELTHTFDGQVSAGFILNTGVASTDTLTKNITLSPVKYVTRVTGTTTANCSYRVTLLNAGGATLWQDVWRSTIGDTLEADVPTSVSQVSQAATVRIEFTDLYLIETNYGVQCAQCYIQVYTYQPIGSHQVLTGSHQVLVGSHQVYTASYQKTVFSATYSVAMNMVGGQPAATTLGAIPAISGGQEIVVTPMEATVYYEKYSSVEGGYVERTFSLLGDSYCLFSSGGSNGTLVWVIGGGYSPVPSGAYNVHGVLTANVSVFETIVGGYTTVYDYITVYDYTTVYDYGWVSSYFMWSSAFNFFEAVDIAFAEMTRTGNPVTLQTIALTFDGDNYVDTLVLVADNPLSITVQAGTGQRPYVVTNDFGSQAGAQAYADGLLLIVSRVREQYSRDVPLSTDLSVGDVVDCDGVNRYIEKVDYTVSKKTITVGDEMSNFMTRMQEQSRRIDSLERKV
jgi:hypothetical protein